MHLTLTFSPAPPEAEALAVGLWQGGRTGAFADTIKRMRAASPRFQAREGEALSGFLPDGRRLVVLGLGKPEGIDAARAERLGAALYAACRDIERLTVRLELSEDLLASVAYGMVVRAWQPPLELRRPAEDAPRLAEAAIAGEGGAWPPLKVLAEAVNRARTLVALPGNLMGPEELAAEARGLEALGCAVEELNLAALWQQGLNLLAGVGQGSARPPRLVAVHWRGAEGPPLAFVGKGITFDTGGLSIKHGDFADMKGDMAGAAAALMGLRVLAARREPVHAVAVLAIAENMPSGRALRPGDVLRSYSGRTVEVVDTDAEGRLVLADALAWACATCKPRAVVDLATLTGAVVTTLGRHHAGLFASDDALAEALLTAGRRSGEPLWRLPLVPAFDEALKSEVADVRNCAWGRVPDALHAARFLQGFVPDGTPWAHLDIAGVADAEEPVKGPTGFGVRLLVDWALG